MKFKVSGAAIVVSLFFVGSVFADQNSRRPYIGLNKASYGPLQAKAPEDCQRSTTNNNPSTEQLSKKITGFLFKKPMSVFPADESVIREELQANFALPANAAYPNVAVLERNQQEITFWYQSPDISGDEVAKAAAQYCGRLRKRATAPNFARFCPPPSPVVIKQAGQPDVQVRVTYVIANSLCVP
jgi:hypothetical protein